MWALDVAFEKDKTDHLKKIGGMIGREPKNGEEAISLFWTIRYKCLPGEWVRSVENHYEIIGRAAVQYRLGW